MTDDDLSQRLWRDGAQLDWREEQILEAVFSEPVPDTPQTVLLKGEIQHLKSKAELKQRLFQGQVEYTKMLQDLFGHFSLYMADDAFVIIKMTLEERELYADAVDAWSARLNAGEEEEPGRFPRWWRDDYVGPLPR